MPLGFERLNVRKQPPNKLINFVEALNGPDKTIAQDFLERIAAIVYPVRFLKPVEKNTHVARIKISHVVDLTNRKLMFLTNSIMRDNGLAVMSLDEFPPNVEFWGRNFNAGECIQLVLKNPKTGEWLPFQFVQGVMIHELAHIKQMNHSRAFWAVNNKFSGQLRVLRSKGYTGEGFWSAGRVLISAEYTQDRPLAESDMPHSLCGGTYRSRERRRKNRSTDGQSTKKPKLTYAERQQRRKERKFGTGEGNKVGTDENTRVELEKGKGKSKSAPKIAQSNRGRELRAAAALKRFGTQQKEVEILKKEEDTGDDTDWEIATDDEDEKTIDVGGGKFLVPVSGEEDGKIEQDEMKRELLELARTCTKDNGGTNLSRGQESGWQRAASDDRRKSNPDAKMGIVVGAKNEDDAEVQELVGYNPCTRALADNTVPRPKEYTASKHTKQASHSSPSNVDSSNRPSLRDAVDGMNARKQSCSACSTVNGNDVVLCMVCANVLEPSKMPNAWSCSSSTCDGSDYKNAGDAGICGVCGQRKATMNASN